MSKIGRKRIGDAARSDLKGLKLVSELDRQNIEFLIKFYDKAFPGVIARVAREARLDIVKERKLRTASKHEKIQFSRRMAIPNGLLQELKRAYPAIIVDKQQFNQFLKWFPQFDLYV